MQEESASPMLKRRSVKAKLEEKEVKVTSVDKEKCFNMGASTGDSFIFTPRSSQPEVALPNLNTSPQLQLVPPFPCLSSPSYIWVPVPAQTFTSFHQPSQSDLMPGHQWMICGACLLLGTEPPIRFSLVVELSQEFVCLDTWSLILYSNYFPVVINLNTYCM